ncbi:papain family cysteine protease domain-containing protein [Ditylenchus destructor]|uniref:Papain family cysteine protease domain-containing protein n=1 Tax=Ditylenchus destructor TaxID=166010 RepID=A0AAD4MDY2_9BILA|nr:papain family cysteine protease domain-containing protein [Ditylenchus destructor]
MASIIHAMVTSDVLDLSPQHLIDCDHMVDDEGKKNDGCNEGMARRALYYIRSIGIALEEHYEYEEKTNSNCDESKLHNLITFNVFRSGVPFIQIDDNEPALKEALIKYGPLLVSVNASLTTFKNYKYIVDDADVYADPKCKGGSGLHAMILVGCGTHPLDGDFWILKNSWDVTWGKNGYMWMAAKFAAKLLHEQTSTEREKNRDGNMCGIADLAFRPNVIIPNFNKKFVRNGGVLQPGYRKPKYCALDEI